MASFKFQNDEASLGKEKAPILASFSSWGPKPLGLEILKLNVIALDLNILATFILEMALSKSPYDPTRSKFNILLRTCANPKRMACLTEDPAIVENLVPINSLLHTPELKFGASMQFPFQPDGMGLSSSSLKLSSFGRLLESTMPMIILSSNLVSNQRPLSTLRFRKLCDQVVWRWVVAWSFMTTVTPSMLANIISFSLNQQCCKASQGLVGIQTSII
ncbi:hypothetical protein Vadar_006504 [Vaccinium darrowii]|uniref:Uncharacterized protein n=1 Tax=Vaccinium darrowii TaxID=229202 RepID=A0ACB7XXV5_9ERIC|nr:hypothetical protein Vadar_006504 [Vaccinium darrowii]